MTKKALQINFFPAKTLFFPAWLQNKKMCVFRVTYSRMSISRQEGGRRSEVITERQKKERPPLGADRGVSSKQPRNQKQNADKKDVS